MKLFNHYKCINPHSVLGKPQLNSPINYLLDFLTYISLLVKPLGSQLDQRTAIILENESYQENLKRIFIVCQSLHIYYQI